MRRILEERAFPVDELRLLRLGPVGRAHAAVEGHATSSWRTPPPPTRPVSTSPCSPPAPPARGPCAPKFAAAGAVVIDNSSAWRMDPDVPARRRRGEPARPRPPPQGHRRQPELHDHGLHAGAEAAARRGRPRRPGREQLPGRVGCRPGRRGGARRAGPQGGRRRRRPHLRRRRRRVPGAARSSPGPIAFNVLPFAGKLVDDGTGETDEEQKLRNESRKILEIPELPVSGTCVRVPVFTGHSLSINAALRAAHLAGAGPPSCWPPRPAWPWSTSPRRSLAAGKDPAFVGRIRRDPTVEHGLALFVVERQPPQGRGAQRRPDRRAGGGRVAQARSSMAGVARYRRAAMAANRRCSWRARAAAPSDAPTGRGASSSTPGAPGESSRSVQCTGAAAAARAARRRARPVPAAGPGA